MGKPTKEQERKLWEWCGFTIDKQCEEKLWWNYPDGSYKGLELPPIDLNNLFKYAVPLVRETLGADELSRRLQGWISDVILAGINPEVALFWVLDKVREDKK